MSQAHRPVLSEQQREQAPQVTVLWPADSEPADQWLSRQPLKQLKANFEANGFLALPSLLTPKEVQPLSELYDWLLAGRIDASSHRHDLGNTQAVQNEKFGENICQIMWPSLFAQGLSDCPARARLLLLARHLLGDDVAFDFDMMLAKPPMSHTPTPWHVDEAYWPDLPDKRAVSCWIAVDETRLDNGCMWFAAGSHLRQTPQHAPAGPNTHVLACDGSEQAGTPCPLQPGGCTLHTGRTLHYSRGNSTNCWRRGYVINFRPVAMVELERVSGFDHGRVGVGNIIGQHLQHQ